MKLINLAKIFLTLVVAINLLATCEAKRVKKHSVLTKQTKNLELSKPKLIYILAGEGEACHKPYTKCVPPFVCKYMASDINKGITGMSKYCQRATGLIKPIDYNDNTPLPHKPSIRIVKEGKVCSKLSIYDFPATMCEKGLVCRERSVLHYSSRGGSKICQKPTIVMNLPGGNQNANKQYFHFDQGKPREQHMTGVNGAGINPDLIQEKPRKQHMTGVNGQGINPDLFQNNLVI